MTAAPCPYCPRGASPSWLVCPTCAGLGFVLVAADAGRARRELEHGRYMRVKLAGAK